MRRALVIAIWILGACRDRAPEERPRASRPPAKVAAPVPPKVAPAKPDAGVGSPLPEVGPHPDYPTPVRAGTEKIFVLEDPDRGPPAPLKIDMPRRDALAWTTHAYCEDDSVAITCSAGPARSHRSWRVGRKGKGFVVAESLRGTTVEETYVYVARSYRARLDRRGRVVSAIMFDASGRGTGRARDGSNTLAGCGHESYAVDAGGRVIERGCLQWTGEPMQDTSGVVTTRYVRDRQGFVIEKSAFDSAGTAIVNLDGAHRTLYDRAHSGELRIERYRAIDGTPVRDRNGCHGRRTERDDDGATVRTVCLDQDDRPALDLSGVGSTTIRHDARGCPIAVRYHDAAAKPMAKRTSVHGINYEVDASCASTTHTCVGLTERPISCSKNDAARYVYARDGAGNITSIKHYDASGGPSTSLDHDVFETRSEWDDLGHQIARSCHDRDGAAVICVSTGFHGERLTYDDAGRHTETRYVDVDGKPTTNLDTAIRRYRYDNYDHLVETTSLGLDGALVDSRGMTTRRTLYDETHRSFGIVLLDKKGDPANYRSCYIGVTCPTKPWHAVRIARRADGLAEKNLFFDAAGQLMEIKLCAKVRCFR